MISAWIEGRRLIADGPELRGFGFLPYAICRLVPSPSLADLRRHTAAQLARLPESLHTLGTAPMHAIELCSALQTLARTINLAL